MNQFFSLLSLKQYPEYKVVTDVVNFKIYKI